MIIGASVTHEEYDVIKAKYPNRKLAALYKDKDGKIVVRFAGKPRTPRYKVGAW